MRHRSHFPGILEMLWVVRAPSALLDGPTTAQPQATPRDTRKPLPTRLQARKSSTSRLLPVSCCVELPHPAQMRPPLQRFRARPSARQRCQRVEWRYRPIPLMPTPLLMPCGSRCGQSQSLLLGPLALSQRRYGNSHTSFLALPETSRSGVAPWNSKSIWG